MTPRTRTLVFGLAGLFACSAPSNDDAGNHDVADATDASTFDTQPDVRCDARENDAPPDAPIGMDVVSDSATDAVVDVARDAVREAGSDGAPDVPADIPSEPDATIDTGVDVGGDVASDDSADVTVRHHIATWAYVGGFGGQTDGTTATSTNATSTQHIRTWIDYAEAGSDPNQKAFLDCTSGCTPVVYFDAAKKYLNCAADQTFVTAVSGNESAWYHQASPATSSNRIEQTNAPGCGGATTAYYPNGGNAGVQSFWQSYVRSGYPANTWGFSDDSGAWCTVFNSTTPSTIPVELGSSSTCAMTHVQQYGELWGAMTFASGAAMPMVFNGLSAPSAYQVQTDLSEVELPTVRGGCAEGFVVGRGPTIFPRAVSSSLDTMSLIDTTTDRYWLMLAYINQGATGPCTVGSNAWYQNCGALQQRRVALGTYWLGYEPGHEVLWTATNVARQLQVFPEESIVPTMPVQSMTPFVSGGTNGSGCGTNPGSGGAVDLLVHCGTLSDGTPDGVYRREFAACFNFGTLVGPCAVIVNTTASAVTVQASWLTGSHTSSVTVVNSDVLAAGCGNGPCPTTALDPHGATFTVGTTQAPAVDALFLF